MVRLSPIFFLGTFLPLLALSSEVERRDGILLGKRQNCDIGFQLCGDRIICCPNGFTCSGNPTVCIRVVTTSGNPGPGQTRRTITTTSSRRTATQTTSRRTTTTTSGTARSTSTTLTSTTTTNSTTTTIPSTTTSETASRTSVIIVTVTAQPTNSGKAGISGGAIAGIAIGVGMVFLGALWAAFVCIRKRELGKEELKAYEDPNRKPYEEVVVKNNRVSLVPIAGRAPSSAGTGSAPPPTGTELHDIQEEMPYGGHSVDGHSTTGHWPDQQPQPQPLYSAAPPPMPPLYAPPTADPIPEALRVGSAVSPIRADAMGLIPVDSAEAQQASVPAGGGVVTTTTNMSNTTTTTTTNSPPQHLQLQTQTQFSPNPAGQFVPIGGAGPVRRASAVSPVSPYTPQQAQGGSFRESRPYNQPRYSSYRVSSAPDRLSQYNVQADQSQQFGGMVGGMPQQQQQQQQQFYQQPIQQQGQYSNEQLIPQQQQQMQSPQGYFPPQPQQQPQQQQYFPQQPLQQYTPSPTPQHDLQQQYAPPPQQLQQQQQFYSTPPPDQQQQQQQQYGMPPPPPPAYPQQQQQHLYAPPQQQQSPPPQQQYQPQQYIPPQQQQHQAYSQASSPPPPQTQSTQSLPQSTSSQSPSSTSSPPPQLPPIPQVITPPPPTTASPPATTANNTNDPSNPQPVTVARHTGMYSSDWEHF